MEISKLSARLSVEGLHEAQSHLGSFDKSLKQSSGSLGAFGAAAGHAAVVGVAALGAAVAAVGGYAVKSAADFEQSMSGIKAVSGATVTEMQGLTTLAMKLGADTVFSAGEAAKGIEELIKGGLSIQDVMSGAAEATLNLATAGGVSLTDAAEIAANAMAMFRIQGSGMAHVADMIAGAANASSLSVIDFKYSLASVGAVAALVGQNFDSTAVAIALMGKNGLKGMDAGTSLKTMLMNLQPTTKTGMAAMQQLGLVTLDTAAMMDEARKRGLSLGGSIEDVGERLFASITGWKEGQKITDKQTKAWQTAQKELHLMSNAFINADGSFKDMRGVAGALQKALAGLTDAEKEAALQAIFGSDAIRAAAILAREGAAGYDEMADSMGKVTAASVAAERLNNLKGSMEQLKGSVETAGIALGTAFLPFLRKMTDSATSTVNSWLPWINTEGPKLAQTFTNVATGVSELARSVASGDLDGFLIKLNLLTGVDLWNLVKGAQSLGDTFAKGGFGAAAQQIQGWLQGEWAKIDWGAVWAGTQNAAAGMLGGLQDLLFGGLEKGGAGQAAVRTGGIAKWIQDTFASIPWGDIWQGVKSTAGDIWGGLLNVLLGEENKDVGQSASRVGGVISSIQNAFAGINWSATVTAIGNGFTTALTQINIDVTAVTASLTERLKGVSGAEGGKWIGDRILEAVRGVVADPKQLALVVTGPFGIGLAETLKAAEWLTGPLEQMTRIGAELVGALGARLNEGVSEIVANFFASLKGDIGRMWNTPGILGPAILPIPGVDPNPDHIDAGTGRKRAAGGPVSAGDLFLVGEKGPELFVPKTAGSIIPNGAFTAAAAGAGPNVDTSTILGMTTVSVAAFRSALDAATSSLRGLLTPSASISANALSTMTTAATAATARWNVDPWAEGKGYPQSMRKPSPSIDPYVQGQGYPEWMRKPSPEAGYMPPAWTPAPQTDPRLASAIERLVAGDQTQKPTTINLTINAPNSDPNAIATVVVERMRSLGLSPAGA